MPTIRDVAREAGVSVASASRALNGHSNVTDATRSRVEDAARRLHFVPHSGARSLTRRRTDAIGVILPDLFGEFFSEIVRGIDRVAHGAGKQLLLGNMHGNALESAMAIRAMHGRVDGLLVMPPDVDDEFLAVNLPKDLPTVVLNCDGTAAGVPSVAIDNYTGAYRLTRALIESGCRRIAHIAGPVDNRDARERLRGFSQAMADHANERAPLVLPGDFTEAAGAAAARVLIAGHLPVDAVFAANDMMAVGCMTVLADADVAIPGQVAIAGFDDIPLARFAAPALTTMRVHMDMLGATAAQMLLDRLGGGEIPTTRATIITPELVMRESTCVAGSRWGKRTDQTVEQRSLT